MIDTEGLEEGHELIKLSVIHRLTLATGPEDRAGGKVETVFKSFEDREGTTMATQVSHLEPVFLKKGEETRIISNPNGNTAILVSFGGGGGEGERDGKMVRVVRDTCRGISRSRVEIKV